MRIALSDVPSTILSLVVEFLSRITDKILFESLKRDPGGNSFFFVLLPLKIRTAVMQKDIQKNKIKTITSYLRMESFTNNVIDLSKLPRFETVAFQKLKPNYWKVVLINQLILSFVFATALGVLYFLIPEFRPQVVYPAIGLGVLMILILVFSRIAFLKKGFAFREQDVLFRDGVIATNTTIIPYNRVQHVALHEGWLSRYFGLATVEIFTAGGSSSDIKIPGIEKEQAENIKQLLMGKIQQQL